MFDGINDHVFIHDDASNNINSFLGSSSATFSVWVKVSTQVANSATYDIISNYDDASAITDISGLYIISLVDTGGNGQLKLRTQVRFVSATGTATGSVTINDNNWKLQQLQYQEIVLYYKYNYSICKWLSRWNK